MCRGGRMFAPTKTWRRWHRKISVNQRRFALASALAASALPALVMARGHRVEHVPEVPLVVASERVKQVDKTKAAAALLKQLAALDDVEKAKDSRKIRRGKGKMRNRRYVSRRGPLVVYDASKDNVSRGFRNLPGVDLCDVSRLNLLQLAPGGHVGRFVVWTQNAFARLDAIYGTQTRPSQKVDYHLPRSIITNPDISRIINSEEIQVHLRPVIQQRRFHALKKNPLRNLGALIKLNPYAKTLRRREALLAEERKKKRHATVEALRKRGADKGKKGGVPAKTKKEKKPAAKPKKPHKVLKSKDHRKQHKKFVKTLLS